MPKEISSPTPMRVPRIFSGSPIGRVPGKLPRWHLRPGELWEDLNGGRGGAKTEADPGLSSDQEELYSLHSTSLEAPDRGFRPVSLAGGMKLK